MFQRFFAAAVLVSSLVGCAALYNGAPINLGKNDSAAKTYAPIINSMTANPTNTTTGQPLTFDVKATDPNNQQLQYNWSTPNGVISSSAGQTVSWTPPSTAGSYPVQVVITNLEGKSTSGTINVIVKADGTVTAAAAPSPTPTATASN